MIAILESYIVEPAALKQQTIIKCKSKVWHELKIIWKLKKNIFFFSNQQSISRNGKIIIISTKFKNCMLFRTESLSGALIFSEGPSM